MRQIGCLMTPSPCSQGCADDTALEMPSTISKEVSLNTACPELTWFFVSPVTQGVGSYIDLEAEAEDADGDFLFTTWSVVPDVDFIDDPHSGYTSFYCEAPGTYRLSLAIEDNVCAAEVDSVPVYCVE